MRHKVTIVYKGELATYRSVQGENATELSARAVDKTRIPAGEEFYYFTEDSAASGPVSIRSWGMHMRRRLAGGNERLPGLFTLIHGDVIPWRSYARAEAGLSQSPPHERVNYGLSSQHRAGVPAIPHERNTRVSRQMFMDDGTWAREGDLCLSRSPLRYGTVVSFTPHRLDDFAHTVRWDDGEIRTGYLTHGLQAVESENAGDEADGPVCSCIGPARDKHDLNCPVRIAYPREGDPPRKRS